MSGLQGSTGDQAERQIVDQVVCDRDGKAGHQGPGSGRKMLGPGQPSAGQFECADAFNGIDHDEQAGNKREGSPADLVRQLQRVRSRLDRHSGSNRQSR